MILPFEKDRHGRLCGTIRIEGREFFGEIIHHNDSPSELVCRAVEPMPCRINSVRLAVYQDDAGHWHLAEAWRN